MTDWVYVAIAAAISALVVMRFSDRAAKKRRRAFMEQILTQAHVRSGLPITDIEGWGSVPSSRDKARIVQLMADNGLIRIEPSDPAIIHCTEAARPLHVFRD